MEHPINSPKLSELAKGKPDCVIIISDHTRPVPSPDILPHMVRELREGNPDIDQSVFNALHAVCIETFPGWKEDGEQHSFLEKY